VKLAHYFRKNLRRVAIVQDWEIFDLAEAARGLKFSKFRDVTSIDEVLHRGLLDQLEKIQERIVESGKGLPIKDAKLLSPILFPEKIFMVAVNYLSHSQEQGAKLPPEPYFFTKFRNAIIGPGEPIIIPKVSTKVDWEVELAVIVGKGGKYVPKNEAMNYVAGYTVSNDISFRDLQFPQGQPERLNPLGRNWVKGKGLDSSLPLGPWLVTKDEIPDPYELEISLSVNGGLKQKSHTGEMVFKIDSLIEYLSAGITLRPGDIISTGTPQGVAIFTDQPYLKDGDVVEATISNIGMLRNPVKSEQ